MKGKKVGLNKGNGTEDEGMLRSKRLTTEWISCVLTTLITLGQPVSMGTFLMRQVKPSLHGFVQKR